MSAKSINQMAGVRSNIALFYSFLNATGKIYYTGKKIFYEDKF